MKSKATKQITILEPLIKDPKKEKQTFDWREELQSKQRQIISNLVPPPKMSLKDGGSLKDGSFNTPKGRGYVRGQSPTQIGFGEFKEDAINLLAYVVEILNEFKIQYCLISGTLLGFVRHRDFIPWDDDIDLLVDSTIIQKWPQILESYPQIGGINKNDGMFKLFEKTETRGLEISTNYRWPFVDLFVYHDTADANANGGSTIQFFDKSWNKSAFFPPIQRIFNDIPVMIPREPLYFLFINYGKDCLTTWITSSYSHRTEQPLKEQWTIDAKTYRIINKQYRTLI